MADQTIIITGGSRGIGLATALRFGRAGYNVVIAARHQDQLDQAAEQVRATGAACHPVVGDVSKRADAERLVEETVAQFGGLTVLVNNAGYAPTVNVNEMSDDDYETTLGANCDATFFLCRAAWPHLKKAGDAVIVNISSRASIDPFPGFAVYGGCKAWVNTFTRALSKQGKPAGIRVYAVAPGATETAMLRGALPDMPKDQTLDPDDVAAVIEGVCDPRFGHSVGETIMVEK
jgi:NAD(P)-dependent dehydrogenase (short-subunit alcohol dehydrogenase family)